MSKNDSSCCLEDLIEKDIRPEDTKPSPENKYSIGALVDLMAGGVDGDPSLGRYNCKYLDGTKASLREIIDNFDQASINEIKHQLIIASNKIGRIGEKAYLDKGRRWCVNRLVQYIAEDETARKILEYFIGDEPVAIAVKIRNEKIADDEVRDEEQGDGYGGRRDESYDEQSKQSQAISEKEKKEERVVYQVTRLRTVYSVFLYNYADMSAALLNEDYKERVKVEKIMPRESCYVFSTETEDGPASCRFVDALSRLYSGHYNEDYLGAGIKGYLFCHIDTASMPMIRSGYFMFLPGEYVPHRFGSNLMEASRRLKENQSPLIEVVPEQRKYLRILVAEADKLKEQRKAFAELLQCKEVL